MMPIGRRETSAITTEASTVMTSCALPVTGAKTTIRAAQRTRCGAEERMFMTKLLEQTVVETPRTPVTAVGRAGGFEELRGGGRSGDASESTEAHPYRQVSSRMAEFPQQLSILFPDELQATDTRA